MIETKGLFWAPAAGGIHDAGRYPAVIFSTGRKRVIAPAAATAKNRK